QVTVPMGTQPVSLWFELRAGEMAWYPRPLLHVQIYVNERTHQHLIFQTDHQSAQIRLLLPPAVQSHCIPICTDHSFMGENPSRRLTIQLRQVLMTERDPGLVPVKSLDDPESTLRQALELCQQAGPLGYDKLRRLYPAFEEGLDAWITPRLGFSIQP